MIEEVPKLIPLLNPRKTSSYRLRYNSFRNMLSYFFSNLRGEVTVSVDARHLLNKFIKWFALYFKWIFVSETHHATMLTMRDTESLSFFDKFWALIALNYFNYRISNEEHFWEPLRKFESLSLKKESWLHQKQRLFPRLWRTQVFKLTILSFRPA